MMAYAAQTDGSADSVGVQPPPDMILIPAGPFFMGSNELASERPASEVWVDAFYIDRYPVTNAQFRAFWEAGMYDQPEAPCWQGLQKGYRWIREDEMRRTPRYWYDRQWNQPDHPIVGITWYEALAYARWVGKRLPTEAEWEKAARGTDGRRYPWGNEYTENRCGLYIPNHEGAYPVGHFSPAGDSPYGVADMAGNVWEWTSSLHRPYPYQADDGREDLEESAGRRVLRGGSWQSRFPQHAQCTHRYFGEPNFGFATVGFRCVMMV